MSFLGGITVTLEVHNRKVEKASVKPDKEVKAEQLFIGKEPGEALDLIENLFALCPRSQRAAAEAAISTALNGPLDEEQQGWLARTIQTERISEAFRFFVLQLPKLKWRQKHTNEIASQWRSIKALESKIPEDDHWRVMQDAVAAEISPFVHGAFETTWDNDLLNGTFKGHLNDITSVFSELSKNRTVGWSSVPPLNISNKVFLENLKSTGTPLEKFATGPFDFFTGACARMRYAPLTSALLKSDGPSAYTRFAARFEEFLHDLQSRPNIENLASSLQLADSSALSIVQNSRGALLHYVKLDKTDDGKDVIADYCILTPTEINVTKAPSFTKSLEGIQARNVQELKELANLVTLSYDPCTEIKLELDYA